MLIDKIASLDAKITPDRNDRDMQMIGPRARIALDELEAEAVSLRNALRRNKRAREALAVIVALTTK